MQRTACQAVKDAIWNQISDFDEVIDEFEDVDRRTGSKGITTAGTHQSSCGQFVEEDWEETWRSSSFRSPSALSCSQRPIPIPKKIFGNTEVIYRAKSTRFHQELISQYSMENVSNGTVTPPSKTEKINILPAGVEFSSRSLSTISLSGEDLNEISVVSLLKNKRFIKRGDKEHFDGGTTELRAPKRRADPDSLVEPVVKKLRRDPDIIAQ
ncbi:hypothetical protein SNEBB_006156 [Seison nebaliae]|nr:hypothetical protein SNEBB_006156 [Seison nebaliae]